MGLVFFFTSFISFFFFIAGIIYWIACLRSIFLGDLNWKNRQFLVGTILILIILSLNFGKIIISGHEKNNQQTQCPSLDSQYSANIQVESGWWRPVINDRHGKTLYKEERDIFRGNLKIYWGWDAKNVFWIYNSDNGKIEKYEISNGRVTPSSGDKKLCPQWILPETAKY